MHRAKKIPTAIADDYLNLVRKFPLRPIRKETDYDQAVEILGDLVGRADEGLSSGERDYVDALSRFVQDYDEAQFPIDRALKTPIARLKYLMEQQGMKTTDLGELVGGRGQASLILNGKRELSKANIHVLAERFKVSPAAFL